MKLFDIAKSCILNENGSPSIETLIGIVMALGVGVGVVEYGKTLKDWYTNKAATTVNAVEVPSSSALKCF